MAAIYRWDSFVLDLDAYRLERDGRPLSLEPKAFNLLALMVQRPGHLFSKQEIFEAVWPDTAVTDHALTRVVAQLRRVLGDEAREARYIETVPTRGYRWVPAVQTTEPDKRAATVAPPPTATIATQPTATPAAQPTPTQTFTPIPTLIPTPVPVVASPVSRFVFRGLTLALLLLTALLALAIWTARDRPAAASTSVTRSAPDIRWPVQVTTNAGLDLQPALSPQDDALAYVSDRSGALEIYVRTLEGSGAAVPLTNDGAHNVQPAWSPDGRLIAFHSYRHGGVWVIPARGGTARQLAPTGSNPAWSPDGSHVAFQSDEHADVTPSAFGAQSGSTIWIVTADGSNLRQLTKSGQPIGGHAAPAWTPDGRHLAFTVFEAGADNGVWILNLETGLTKPLQRGAGLFESVFAPDNRALYVAGGEALIVRFPFDATTTTITGERQLLPVPGVPGVRGLSISADGRRLAFAGLGLSSHIWSQEIDREGSAAGKARPLTTDTSRRISLPTISPDGSKIAYLSTRAGEPPNVWMMNVDGSQPTQLTSNETAEFKPQWLPDGKSIAYFSNRGETPGIWRIDLTTRREELVLGMHDARKSPFAQLLSGSIAEFSLSRTLRRAAVAVMTPPAGRRVVYDVQLDSFQPRALTDGQLSVGYPAWSPDERSIAVEIKEGSSTHAGVIDVERASLRKLTNERGQTWVRSWSPDSRKVAVAALRDGIWNLRWIDVVTGGQGAMTAPEPANAYVRYPQWSPRGDLVVFERGELRGNVWLLALQ